MHNKNKSNKGFTLIELLVVIAIIGLLASVIMASLSTARSKARDTRRLSDMEQIQIALELYLSDNGQYPNGASECSGWDSSLNPVGSPAFIAPLAPTYINPVPLEVIYDSNCLSGYLYNRYGPGAHGCDPQKGSFYILEVPGMEAPSAVHPASPGFSCPSRDWQTEAKWVTGKFEKG